jgi:hypothetical protein
MNMNDKNNSEDVINSIKSSQAKMRPRSYFAVRTTLILIGAILLFFLVLFMAIFMIFALQENGGFFAAHFGITGWGIFFGSLPWTPFLLSLVLLLILWLLLRRYPTVYHQPFLYILLILIVVISLASFALSVSTIPGGIFRYVARNRIPIISGVYAFETAPMSGIYRGEVIVLASSSFVLGNDLGQTSTVLFVSTASGELRELAPGDYVLIFGHGVATATIQASGVEQIVDYR